MDRQIKAGRNYDILRYCNSIQIGSTAAVQREDGGNVVEKGDPQPQ